MRKTLYVLAALSVLGLGACSDTVSSEEEAELAYLGLDTAIERAINLGFAGFNAASSANIPAQEGAGDVSGTMTISGQVDQGTSSNKGMRLLVALDAYADVLDLSVDEETEFSITYLTDPERLPKLDFQLRSIPTGNFTGTLDGLFFMDGELEGEVTLALSMAGDIEEDPADPGKIRRVPGTTTITGTATSGGGGVFDVNVTR